MALKPAGVLFDQGGADAIDGQVGPGDDIGAQCKQQYNGEGNPFLHCRQSGQ